MSCGSSRVQNSSKNKTFNKKIFSEIELSLVQKYLKLKCDEQNKKRIINESLRRKVLRRRALEAIPKIKVVRNLTNFKILPRETEQIESIPLPKTPEPSVSNANLKLLIDSHKTKDALEILGFSHIITIYVGNTIVKVCL